MNKQNGTNTLDLRDEFARQEEIVRKNITKPTYFNRNAEEKDKKRQEQVEKIYAQPEEKQSNVKKIEVPAKSREKGALVLLSFFILASAIAGTFIATKWYYSPKQASIKAEDGAKVPGSQAGWYSIELSNGQKYFGQIPDPESDPIKMSNAYYNYEQLADPLTKIDETGNLKLVKRGNETHGPSGEIMIPKQQVLLIEPLRQDSKVLKAILENEKQGSAASGAE